MNGELQVLDTRSGKSAQISINVPDDGLARRPSRISAANNIESYELSPKGERALVLSPRRHLHRADRERANAQPDAFFGRPRQVADLVA